MTQEKTSSEQLRFARRVDVNEPAHVVGLVDLIPMSLTSDQLRSQLELLGLTSNGNPPAPGEADGWASLARGFFGAVRNVAAHRIDMRPDAQLWAMGTVGLISC
jgi:Protein of unknown function (Hypoth_ymh)